MSELQSWARALGGEVSGAQVRCPGPGHSPKDRSLSVRIGRDGEPLVFSHSADDWKECKDHVRSKLGFDEFRPNGKGHANPRRIDAAPYDPRPRITPRSDEEIEDEINWQIAEAVEIRMDQESKEAKKANGEAEPLQTLRVANPALRVANPADWEGKQAPPRRWDVPHYIPHGVPAMLYADGATGKGYLGLQLAIGRAVAKEWIGLLPEPGRTLVLSTEDDFDEMWRRIEGMLPFYGARMADLSDIRLIDLVGENSVLGLLSKGIIEPTPMYEALDEYMTDFKPGMVILDVLADLFSGDESNRPQVTQFMGLLKRLGRKHDCTPLLSAHPSLTGMNTGTGISGSTGWNNSGRARMYFQRVKASDGTEPNKNLRTFEGKKSNYGEFGGKFDLVFEKGLFRRVSGPVGFDKMAAERNIEESFMTTLKRRNSQKRTVSDKPGANYAPAVFAREPEAIAAGVTSKRFEAAMARLFDAGKIRVEITGPPSRQTRSIVIVEDQ